MKKHRKLQLLRETLLRLQTDELTQVAGARLAAGPGGGGGGPNTEPVPTLHQSCVTLLAATCTCC